MCRTQLYDQLAQLFRYPSQDYPGAVEQCRQSLRQQFPQLSDRLDRFSEHVHATRLEDLEELFTRTFDLNPVCCLEVGWHLFREDYNRGAFMVQIRQQLRSCGIVESSELPDHLSHILQLLGRLEDADAKRLSETHVLPALKKMQEGMIGKNNPYEDVLGVVQHLVEARTLVEASAVSQLADHPGRSQ